MRGLPILAGAVLLALAAPAAADDDHRVRTLTADAATAGVRLVDLRLPPGALRVEASPDDRLRLELDVLCEFDDERCEERARRLNVETDRRANALEMRVDGLSGLSARRMKVRGRILVPRGKALELEFPAGELRVRGIGGDLTVEAGFGEVAIVLSEADVRSVQLGVGIGEASLTVAGRRVEGSGWLGQKVRWGEGDGAGRVRVNLGIGEVDVRLD